MMLWKITGERVPLQQVLFNLIMNAIEAMSAVTERERQLTIRAVLNERTSVRMEWSRIPEVELTRSTSTASSTLSLREIPRTDGCPSAAQSSKRTRKLRHRHEVPLGTSFLDPSERPDRRPD